MVSQRCGVILNRGLESEVREIRSCFPPLKHVWGGYDIGVILNTADGGCHSRRASLLGTVVDWTDDQPASPSRQRSGLGGTAELSDARVGT